MIAPPGEGFYLSPPQPLLFCMDGCAAAAVLEGCASLLSFVSGCMGRLKVPVSLGKYIKYHAGHKCSSVARSHKFPVYIHRASSELT